MQKTFQISLPKWAPGKVIKVAGPLSYQIELQSGIIVHHHVDHVRGLFLAP